MIARLEKCRNTKQTRGMHTVQDYKRGGLGGQTRDLGGETRVLSNVRSPEERHDDLLHEPDVAVRLYPHGRLGGSEEGYRVAWRA